MKKKVVIGIIIGIIILLVGVYLFVPINDEQKIIAKANWRYGTDKKCEGHFGEVSSPALSKQKCPLCNNYYTNNWIGGGLCLSCSDITNRCRECGKLKDVEKN